MWHTGDPTSTGPSKKRDSNELKMLTLILLTGFVMNTSSVFSSSSHINVDFNH